MEPYLALLMIVGAFCGVLAFLGWLAERKIDPLERMERRWPKTRGFER